jgi:glycosyltransferase involved in cell wall biosynthesis
MSCQSQEPVDSKMNPAGCARRRILISHQGCVPIYRKSFFARLNEGADMDFAVVHGRAPRGSDIIEASPPFDFPNIEVNNRELRFLGRTFIWQPVLWRAIRGEFDAAVIGEEVKFLSNIAVALALRLRGRPFLFWGFGYHQYDRPQEAWVARATSAIAAGIKGLMYRMASGYLVYTDGGRRALLGRSARPGRMAVLQNTVDTELEDRYRAAVASEPIELAFSELGVRSDSTKLLYFGRLVRTKGVNLLVEYARRCQQSNRRVDLVIFGQGAEEAPLRSSAADLKNVSFHRHDNLKLARALRISAAVVIPGYVGLAVTHGFAHGVPMLTREGQLHSPEVEYIEHSVNGLILPQAPEAFFQALDTFVDDPNLQLRLARGAEQTARSIDMNHMVATFRSLVSECLTSSN